MKTTVNETLKFIHIVAEDGMCITDYKEGDDILNYTSSRQMYCPLSVDLSSLIEITEEQDAEYTALKEQAIEESMNKVEEKKEDDYKD